MGTQPYPAQNPPVGQGRVAILATRPNPRAGFCFVTGKNCLKWQFQAILGHFVTGFFRVGFLVGNPTHPWVAKWAGCQSQNPALPGPLHSLFTIVSPRKWAVSYLNCTSGWVQPGPTQPD